MIPLAKYNKAMYTQVSLGMRFRMMFETEESGVRRYMGTITGISDMDSVRWKNSQWRNLQVLYKFSKDLDEFLSAGKSKFIFSISLVKGRVRGCLYRYLTIGIALLLSIVLERLAQDVHAEFSFLAHFRCKCLSVHC